MREHSDKSRPKDIPDTPIDTPDTHAPKPTNPGYDENVKRDDSKRHPHQGNPPPGK